MPNLVHTRLIVLAADHAADAARALAARAAKGLPLNEWPELLEARARTVGQLVATIPTPGEQLALFPTPAPPVEVHKPERVVTGGGCAADRFGHVRLKCCTDEKISCTRET